MSGGVTSLPLLHLVVAARPNLPKIAALWHALAETPAFCRPRLLHTGQHHDAAMFGQHLADLGLPAPHIALGVAAGGGHAALTGHTMIAAEAAWRAERPDLVVVAGDVDGTLAAALAARKLGLRVAHLEAGLRSHDRLMPEEINRRAVDAISDLLWAPDLDTAARLLREGHPPDAVRAVGNAMVDSLFRALPAARQRPLPAGLRPGGYGIVTLHRPSNVDDPAVLETLVAALGEVAKSLPLAWPVHPRTAARLGGRALPEGLLALPPQAYLDFIGLLAHARLAATDSGGVQEEAAALGLPCLTLRDSTERPVTLGGNRLVTPSELPAAAAAVLARPMVPPLPIPLWDGQAGARMVAHLREVLA
ncbi:UDP-N-acetylglucosamine 2-epimerase (non-hydrolysing) [Humitalea rosea]|uniref:UDP-N-acetylglucosamine 2-epimerase (Non-hydrolysing) n=1 Tax=Humitalea rosea TaxID=990373 RepID=A0A2W7J686_9PROT|nr:UDP-N-acetylglucosamine 2-epimerase (non-hydrolyzing) [Humitalea rosea]PZW46652.1 UDP-N-acetylglucosamine 2-epimerase (non-hydrolysing) [Humitalea rosea]